MRFEFSGVYPDRKPGLWYQFMLGRIPRFPAPAQGGYSCLQQRGWQWAVRNRVIADEACVLLRTFQSHATRICVPKLSCRTGFLSRPAGTDDDSPRFNGGWNDVNRFGSPVRNGRYQTFSNGWALRLRNPGRFFRPDRNLRV